jgi:hypothetical protein
MWCRGFWGSGGWDMALTTTNSIRWFSEIGNSLPGLSTTIRGDGSYDGTYEAVNETWLIERDGKQCEYPSFSSFWTALSPSPEDLEFALANSATDICHLLHCGLGCGRPISRHELWDGMTEVKNYRDIQMIEGTLSFYVYECSDVTESPQWRRVARIDFHIADGNYSRAPIADLGSGAFPETAI